MNYSTMQESYMRGSRIWQLLAFFVGVFVVSSVNAGTYRLVDLGADVSPTDINNLGTIAGWRKTVTGNVGFVMASGGTLQEIAGTMSANAVNDLGQVAGITPAGAFLLDGTLKTWDGYGGYGINELGQISGNRQLDNPYRTSPLPLDPAIYKPYRWSNLGIATVYPRGTRQGVYADMYILNAINIYGYAVGKRMRYGLVGSSAILTEPEFDAVVNLPIPNGGYASAINDKNLVVGATGNNSTAGEYSHAYLYDYNNPGAGAVDLGTLAGGLTSSAADINNSDQVVGTSWLVTQLTSVNDPAMYHAFLWQNNVMTDLNDVLPSDSGWILTAATAINENGDIVGTGLLNGQARGFLLTTNQGPVSPTPNTAPVAMASADITSGKAPLTVNFSSAGSYDPDGSVASYEWDFGNGDSDTNANPSYSYTTPGTFIATLTVTDNQGMTASAHVQIKVRKGKGRR